MPEGHAPTGSSPRRWTPSCTRWTPTRARAARISAITAKLISLRGWAWSSRDITSSHPRPAIVAGKAVVGGWVWDNMKRGEPSGVVRAFDAVTGNLAWAFDVGNLGRTTLPPENESYTRGTPNVWTVMSADEELGLVYLPTGNETPDFFGGKRLDASEKFASSIIAVDAKTGALRWSYQTAHHDIWDFDLPSQPVLVAINEAPNPPATPAIVVPTKQGHLYVLDRRDGHPLTPIEERTVPQGAVPGDFTSPTQPFQSGLPDLAPPTLTEADMWGLTPMDQLWCRTRFGQLRYHGIYTPPSTQGSISYPGSIGIYEWGSVSIDPRTNRMFANTTWMPFIVTLFPRERYDQMRAQSGGKEPPLAFGGPGEGTPYAASAAPFISPLAMPCHMPPWGHLTAIDLNSRSIAWRLPIGTSRANGPLGIPTGVPMPTGSPNMGGSLVTGSGAQRLTGRQVVGDHWYRWCDERVKRKNARVLRDHAEYPHPAVVKSGAWQRCHRPAEPVITMSSSRRPSPLSFARNGTR
jgi:glucose dehydrogenase